MQRRWGRALITGASSGIGAAIARQVAAEGTETVLVARSADRLRSLAAELPAPSEVLVADLSDLTQLREVIARVARREQVVDLVVNNAGYGATGDLVGRPVDEWLDMVQVNVSAVLALTHAALARFRADGGPGGILNVASVAGFAGSAGFGVYSATKSFLVTFGAAVHDEARADGVTVTTLCPGLTHTEFHERAGTDSLDVPEWFWQSAEEVAAAGLSAVAKGQALVIPGVVNKVAVSGSRLVPLRAQRRVVAAVRARR